MKFPSKYSIFRQLIYNIIILYISISVSLSIPISIIVAADHCSMYNLNSLNTATTESFPCPIMYLGPSYYNITRPLIRSIPIDLCTPLSSTVNATDRILIAILDQCSPATKARNAQLAGAAGLLIYDLWEISGIAAYSQWESTEIDIIIPVVSCSLKDSIIASALDILSTDNNNNNNDSIIVQLIPDRNEWGNIWYNMPQYLSTIIPIVLICTVNILLGLIRLYNLILLKGLEPSLSQICLSILIMSSLTRLFTAIPPSCFCIERVYTSIFFSLPTALLVISTVLMIFYFRDLTNTRVKAHKFLSTNSSRIGFILFVLIFLIMDLSLSIGRGLYLINPDIALSIQGILYALIQLIVAIIIIYMIVKLEKIRSRSDKKNRIYITPNTINTTTTTTNTTTTSSPLTINQSNSTTTSTGVSITVADNNENQKAQQLQLAVIQAFAATNQSKPSSRQASIDAKHRKSIRRWNTLLNVLSLNSRSGTSIAMLVSSLFTILGVIVLIIGVTTPYIRENPQPALITAMIAHPLFLFATMSQIVAFGIPPAVQSANKENQKSITKDSSRKDSLAIDINTTTTNNTNNPSLNSTAAATPVDRLTINTRNNNNNKEIINTPPPIARPAPSWNLFAKPKKLSLNQNQKLKSNLSNNPSGKLLKSQISMESSKRQQFIQFTANNSSEIECETEPGTATEIGSNNNNNDVLQIYYTPSNQPQSPNSKNSNRDYYSNNNNQSNKIHHHNHSKSQSINNNNTNQFNFLTIPKKSSNNNHHSNSNSNSASNSKNNNFMQHPFGVNTISNNSNVNTPIALAYPKPQPQAQAQAQAQAQTPNRSIVKVERMLEIIDFD